MTMLTKSTFETVKLFFSGLKPHFTALPSSAAVEPPEDRRLTNIILFISAALFLLRFIRLFTYPMELMGDEVHDILFSVWRYTGKVGFFYTDFNFAPGNMHHQIMSLFTGFINEHIEYYRIFGMLYSAVFVSGLYLLTKELFNRRTAALAVFMTCVSYTGFFNSRLNLCNNLVPAFMVFCLYFLVLAVSRNIKYAIPYLIVFILGFNTYYNWVLIIPVIIWYLADSYISGKTKNKGFVISMIMFAILAGALYALYCWKAFLPKWNIEAMEGAKAGGNFIMDRLDNFKYLFFQGHPRADQFMTDMPFINTQEALIMLAGLAICVMCIGVLEYRLLIFSLIVFLSGLIAAPTTHQMRIIQASIPISIMAALPLGYVFKKNAKAGFAVIVIIAALYIGFVSHYFTAWEKQLQRSDTNKKFALYMNKTYGDKAVYFEDYDFEVPYFTSLRMKGYYTKAEKTYGSFKINAYWLWDLKAFIGKYYPQDTDKIDIKIYEGPVPGRYPFALVSFPLETKFGQDAARVEGLLSGNAPLVKSLGKEGRYAFSNTLIKETLAYKAISKHNPKAALAYYSLESYPFWHPADFDNKISKLLMETGDTAKAEAERKVFMEKKEYFFQVLSKQNIDYYIQNALK